MADLSAALKKGGALKTPGLSEGTGGSPNRELMASARRALSGNWTPAILGYALFVLLLMSFTFFFLSALIYLLAAGTVEMSRAIVLLEIGANVMQLLLAGAVTVGFLGFFLGIARDGEVQMELLFAGFRRFFTSFAVYFFYSLFILLWSLLLVIPGIIAALRYAMAFYVVADDPSCGPLEALSRSKAMMRGSKWQFFCLHWRFFWWWLLAACFTGGIGYLWLIPYMQTSFAKFYEDVK